MSSLGDNLRRNTRVGVAAWVYGQTLQITRMLVLIYFLGKAGYGVWIFAFSIMSYFALYQFGIANAFIKYSAECHATGDYSKLSRLLSTGLLVSIVFGALVFGLFVAFTDSIVSFFDAELGNRGTTSFVVMTVGVITAFMMSFSVYASVLIGIHRLYLRTYVSVSVGTVGFAVMLALLLLGYDIRAIILIYAVQVLIEVVINAIVVRRLLPDVRINPFHAHISCIKDLASLGGRLQVLGIVSLFVTTLDVLVYMKLFGPAVVGVYGAAQRTALRAQGAAQVAFGALAPASADLLARKELKGLAHVYGTAQRLTALACGWVFIFLAFNSDWAMRFVMDEKYEGMQAWLFSAMCVVYLVHSLTGPGSSMLRGAGMPVREIAYLLLTVGLAFTIVWQLNGFKPISGTYREPESMGVFTSYPAELADLSAKYSHIITVKSPDDADITITATMLPEWLTVTRLDTAHWRLEQDTGELTSGLYPVELIARSAEGEIVGEQRFTISALRGYALLSWQCGLLLASILFIAVCNHFFNVSPISPFGHLALPLLFGAGAAYLLRLGWEQAFPAAVTERWQAFAYAAAVGTAYSPLYFLGAWFLPGLTRKDREQIVRFVPGGHRFLRRLGLHEHPGD